MIDKFESHDYPQTSVNSLLNSNIYIRHILLYMYVYLSKLFQVAVKVLRKALARSMS